MSAAPRAAPCRAACRRSTRKACASRSCGSSAAASCDTELFDLLLLNMRLPEERRGDSTRRSPPAGSASSACSSCSPRYGATTVESAFDADPRPHRHAHARRHRAPFPTAATASRTCSTTTACGRATCKSALEVRKAGERIVFDFTGSSPQVPGNVNLTLNAMQSAVCYALKALLDPELPNNQAAIDCGGDRRAAPAPSPIA